MIIDFHTHAKLSKNIPFLPELFTGAMREAAENGLTAVALTEHFNARGLDDMFDELDRRYPYRGDYYSVEGIKVFPGLEVDVAPHGHVLMIGDRDAVNALRGLLEPYRRDGRFPGFRELMDLTDPLPLLRIGAHPFRESNPLAGYPAEWLARLDAFDLNAKDLYVYGPAMREKVHELARNVGVPVVAGSDTHQELQYGSVFNRLDRDCETVAELREAVRSGGCVVEISPALRTKVKAASTVKSLIKQWWEREADVGRFLRG